MNATKASQIVATALTLLWDGTEKFKERFCCLAVTSAVVQITGLEWGKANKLELAESIRERITTYIGGHDTAYSFMAQERGLDEDWDDPIPDEEVQAFRKKMLEDILAEYVKKEALERQIEVLEQVKKLRESGEAKSEYVCDNIRFQLELHGAPEEREICRDIRSYICGAWGVTEWLAYQDLPSGPEASYAARIVMIDTLIARYRAELAGV